MFILNRTFASRSEASRPEEGAPHSGGVLGVNGPLTGLDHAHLIRPEVSQVREHPPRVIFRKRGASGHMMAQLQAPVAGEIKIHNRTIPIAAGDVILPAERTPDVAIAMRIMNGEDVHVGLGVVVIA